MQTYIIYVDGYEVGRTELTTSEVREYSKLDGVAITKA